MNWLKDVVLCDTWTELLVAAVVGAVGLVVMWGLLVLTFVLFG